MRRADAGAVLRAGAGAGFAAARQTLRWVFELLAEDLRSCLALFLLLRARLLGRERKMPS